MGQSRCFPHVSLSGKAARLTSLRLNAQTYSSTYASPIKEYAELENFISEEKELREKREEKEEDSPENANTEKISMETLLRVFRGGTEAQDSNRFASRLKTENIYAEVGWVVL